MAGTGQLPSRVPSPPSSPARRPPAFGRFWPCYGARSSRVRITGCRFCHHVAPQIGAGNLTPEPPWMGSERQSVGTARIHVNPRFHILNGTACSLLGISTTVSAQSPSSLSHYHLPGGHPAPACVVDVACIGTSGKCASSNSLDCQRHSRTAAAPTSVWQRRHCRLHNASRRRA